MRLKGGAAAGRRLKRIKAKTLTANLREYLRTEAEHVTARDAQFAP